jgi:hypothetical protein
MNFGMLFCFFDFLECMKIQTLQKK